MKKLRYNSQIIVINILENGKTIDKVKINAEEIRTADFLTIGINDKVICVPENVYDFLKEKKI